MPIDITNQTRRVQYVGNGTGPYDFDFEVLEESDIAVYQDDTLLVLTTDYTVTINSDGTGSVTTGSSIPSGDNITIIGARPYQRITDYSTGGDFTASALNDELDSLQIQILQLVERSERAVTLAETTTHEDQLVIPEPSAGALLGWGSSGTELANYSVGDLADLTPTAFYTDPLTGYMGLGRTDPGFWIDFNKTYTDLAPAEAAMFFHMYGTHTADELTSLGQIVGFYAHLDGHSSVGAGVTAAAVYPVRGNGTWGVDGTCTQMRGVMGDARLSSAALSGAGNGVISNGYGGYFEVANETTGTGTITNAHAIRVNCINSDGGVMANGYGVYSFVSNETNGGGITTGWGVRCLINDQGTGFGTYYGLYLDGTITAAATKWAIHSTAAAKSWIEGSVAIGDATSSASGKLLVQDGALTSAAILRSTAAAFTGDVVRVQSDRDANSAFDLISAEVNVAVSNNPVFRVRGDGEVTCDGAFTGGGADYAEYFERLDGGGDDWTGRSVVLDGGKIRVAKPGEEPLGVVSVNPTVVGDAQELHWSGKYECDQFGRVAMESYTVTAVELYIDTNEVIDHDAVPAAKAKFEADREEQRRNIEAMRGKVKHRVIRASLDALNDLRFDPPVKMEEQWKQCFIPSELVPAERGEFEHNERRYRTVEDPEIRSTDANGVTLTRKKLAANYDSAKKYTPRSQRPEWAAVGLMGKLRILKGQATGARWIKLRDVSETVEEWLVR